MINDKQIQLNPSKQLGIATHAVVFEGTLRGEVIAVKLLHKYLSDAPHFVESFKQELRLACHLNHPNLVKCLGASFGETVMLCMSVEKASLKDILVQMKQNNIFFNMKEIICISMDIAFGMHFLHTAKILHRDMNLGNFLVSSDFTVKVSDFGTCRVINDTEKQTQSLTGASFYHSPEMGTNHYSFPCDVWSFGIVIAEICVNKEFKDPPLPTDREEQKSLYNQLISDLPPQDQSESKNLTEDIGRSHMLTFLQRRKIAFNIVQKHILQLSNLVEQCLHIPDKKRWGFSEIVGELMCVDSSVRDQSKPNITNIVNQWATQ